MSSIKQYEKENSFVSDRHIRVCYNIYTPTPLNTLQQEPSTGFVLLKTPHFSILHIVSLVLLYISGINKSIKYFLKYREINGFLHSDSK